VLLYCQNSKGKQWKLLQSQIDVDYAETILIWSKVNAKPYAMIAEKNDKVKNPGDRKEVHHDRI